MDNKVPWIGLALALWVIFVMTSAALVRRTIFAFLLGVLFTAAVVGYCMYYQGLVEMGGILHAICGGIFELVAFQVFAFRRLRSSRPRIGRSIPAPGSAAASRAR